MEAYWPVITDFIEQHSIWTLCIQVVGLLFIRQIVVSIPLMPSAFAVGSGSVSATRAKYGESLWFFIYYTLSFSLGFWYLKETPWFWDPSHYWINAGNSIPDFPIGLQMMYSTQLAFYISASIVVLFLSHARANHKDKLIMLLHHVVTIILLSVSYSFGQHRIGSMVLIVHDCSDIFLEGAKLTRYTGLTNLTNAFFAVFALVFFVTRLVIFPLRILGPIVTQFPRDFLYSIFQCDITGKCVPEPFLAIPVSAFWLLLLGTLQCLHIYWFALIMRMVIRALAVRGVEKDIRSDDEEEEELEKPASPKPKNKKIKTN